ncbi:MAG: hypothetical protein HYZ13_13260 [Acidobacteria bacterium]|nr:hypothetical protein [Acidobacteriota bacterium]
MGSGYGADTIASDDFNRFGAGMQRGPGKRKPEMDGDRPFKCHHCSSFFITVHHRLIFDGQALGEMRWIQKAKKENQ